MDLLNGRQEKRQQIPLHIHFTLIVIGIYEIFFASLKQKRKELQAAKA